MFHQFLKENRFSPIQFLPSITPGGNHLIIELSGCDRFILNSQEQIFEIMKECIDLIDGVVITQVFHQFEPLGIKGVLVLEEGHCSVHTWPEQGKVSVDLYVDHDKDPSMCEKIFMARFEAAKSEAFMLSRGEEMEIKMEKRITYYPVTKKMCEKD